MERQDLAGGRLRFASHASRLRPLLADGALLAVALIWGSTFVMVKDAVTSYPVFSFLALRFSFAALVLLPVAVARRRGRHGMGSADLPARLPRRGPAPLLIGLALFAGYAFQTGGLRMTTPAKAGFITGLSVVIVPLVAALALHQAVRRQAWLGVGLATAGLALLTLRSDLTVNAGDLLVLACALAFAAHILLTGRFAPRYDALALTAGQIVVVALLAGLAAALLESPPLPPGRVLFAAGFTGVLATALAFGVQTIAQRLTSPTHTALIFATEPVFAALFSLLLIGEVLGPRQVAGCGLILAGMVVAEVLQNGQTAAGAG